MEKNFYTEEEKYWSRGGNTGTLPSRITPSGVNVLEHNEVFVFGSSFQQFGTLAHVGIGRKVGNHKPNRRGTADQNSPERVAGKNTLSPKINLVQKMLKELSVSLCCN